MAKEVRIYNKGRGRTSSKSKQKERGGRGQEAEEGGGVNEVQHKKEKLKT